MLSAESQVLVRNQSLFEQGNWLLANPTDPHIFTELKNVQLTGFHQYFDTFSQAKANQSDVKHIFAAEFPTNQLFDGAVLYMPKAKAQARMLLANLAACIKPQGQIMLVGENKAGIKSAAKLLESVSDRVNKLDSARHCSLFCGQMREQVPSFKLTDYLTVSDVSVNTLDYKIASLPGVFSHGEIDDGSRLLLENIKHIPDGNILDFGCGAGVIGCYLASLNKQAKVTMSDVSALAVYCSQKSAELNDLKVEVIASDGMKNIQPKFNGIFTNPPFHTGIKTDYSVTEDFIKSLSKHLLPNGQVSLVANRFLKYPDLLQQYVAKPQVVAQTGKFNVYNCRK